MEKIICESDLLRYNFQFVKVDKIHLNGSYVELECDIDEFASFCKKHNIDTIFYSYSFYNPDFYYISDELLEENTSNKKEKEFCKYWAEKYNKEVSKYNFKEPNSLILCALIGQLFVAWEMQNEWNELKEAKEELIDYLDEHEDEILNLYGYDTMSLEEELSKVLLSDKSFRLSTNQSSRYDYMKSFMAKKENKKYWDLTKRARTDWDRERQLINIVDRIYSDYRNTCYSLKIKVGEEIPEEDLF